MNALMSPFEEFSPEMASEKEDFDRLWADEDFCNDLMEAISENFALEVEASRMLAQREINDG